MLVEQTYKRFNNHRNPTSIGKYISKITKGDPAEIRTTLYEILEEELYREELLMPIVQFGINSKVSEIIKLSYMIISNIPLVDEKQNLLPASLLLCNSLVMNLSHPNEHITTLTLRLIGNISNYEILSQIIQKVVGCVGNDFYRIRLESLNTILKIRMNFPSLVPANIHESVANLLKKEDRGEVFVTAYSALRIFNKQMWLRVSSFYLEKRWETIGLAMKCIILEAITQNSGDFNIDTLKLIKTKAEETFKALPPRDNLSIKFMNSFVSFLKTNRFELRKGKICLRRATLDMFKFLITYIKRQLLSNELLLYLFGIIKDLICLNKDIFNFHLRAVMEILDCKKEEIYFNENQICKSYKLEEDLLEFVFSRVKASDLYIVTAYIESYVCTNAFKQTPLSDNILAYITKIETYNKGKGPVFKALILKTIIQLTTQYTKLSTTKVSVQKNPEISNYEKFLNPTLQDPGSEIEEIENKKLVFIKNQALPIIQLSKIYHKVIHFY